MNNHPTCRQCDGGAPKCKLGVLPVSTVEVKGNSFVNIFRSQEAGRNVNGAIPVLGENQYDLMVIGEAPNSEDDKIGLPFQGRTGELTVKFLVSAGINLERTYGTYISKCKPPKGRKPSIEELKSCRPYLTKEIQTINPKVILLLGSSSLRLFNLHNEGGVTSIRGKVFKKKLPGWDDGPEFTIVCSVNPATFLYHDDKANERSVLGDYRLVRDLLKGIDPKDRSDCTIAKYKVISTEEDLDWLVSKLESSEAFSFDTESTGLPWSKNPMLCMSFCWGYSTSMSEPQAAVLPFYNHDPDSTLPFKLLKRNPNLVDNALVKLDPIFRNAKIQKIAHNIKYDVNAVRYHTGLRVQGFWWDTMVMHHLLNEKRPHDLEYLSDIEFGYGDYSFSKREIVGHGKVLRCTYDNIPDEILWPYAATDAEACFRLFCVYRDRLNAQPELIQFYKEESEPLLKELVTAEWRGTLIDKEIVLSLKDEYEKNQAQVLTNLRRKVTSVIPNVSKEDEAHDLLEFNPLSPTQLKTAAILMGYGPKLVKPESPSGFSADKNVLLELAEENEFFKDILKYRNNQKLISTYLENVLKDIDADGKVRYSWLLHGTETGRLSNRFYHQMPKLNEERTKAGKYNLRDMVVASPGYKFVYADYSQVELRLLAVLANDTEMLRIFKNPDADIHRATAAEILGIPEQGRGKIKIQLQNGRSYYVEAEVNKTNRTEIGKRVNFGLAYGSEGFNLIHTGKWVDINGNEHGLTWDMLKAGMSRWKRRFSGVASFIDDIADETRGNKGVVTNVFGRKRRFGARLTDPNEGIRKAAQRELVNFPIQSVAGSLTNRTIVEIGRILDTFNVRDKICLVNTVHDSIMYEVKEELVSWMEDVIHKVGNRPIPQLNNECFQIDIGVGSSWAEAES